MKLIDIKNLTFEYFRRGDEGEVTEMIEALKGVSLDVEAGQFIAIIGENGSGKSTLAKHINALLLPGSGEVIVDGMDTEDEELRLSIRQTAGFVFQNPDNQIVANIVEEDVAFGPENIGVSTGDIWNRVDGALEITGMEKYRQKSPNQLSGGEKQLVAIAGVLAMEPKCIIFDEATSMLDPAGKKTILKTAKKLCQENGITIVWITHDMEEVLEADRVFVMKDGLIEAEGKPDDIFKDAEMLEKCGLALPPMFFYLNFLVGQGIISKEESECVHGIKHLERLLCEKYGNGTNGKNKGHENDVYKVSESGDVKHKSINPDGFILDGISYVYNRGFANETYALKNVSLSIGKGEFAAVIGHTGSGKSTLMQHLNGLLSPVEGHIYFNGQDINDKDFSVKELRKKVGLVFQYPEHQLFADTVENDVSFGPSNMNIPKLEVQKRTYGAIASVGLPDTIYDLNPLELSGGERRRVAIAGVLAMQPEYLVLDEPTAGMSPKASRELMEMLEKLCRQDGVTIIVVTHSMEEAAEFADHVIVLDSGEVCMDGAAHEVFSRSEELKKAGLDVPVGMKIVNALKNVIKDINAMSCKTADICGELLKLKGDI